LLVVDGDCHNRQYRETPSGATGASAISFR
jgi:hypothetical protein